MKPANKKPHEFYQEAAIIAYKNKLLASTSTASSTAKWNAILSSVSTYLEPIFILIIGTHMVL